MSNNNMWWESYSESFSGTCVECSEPGIMMSDRILTEMIQKNIIKPEDLSRINDPSFPKDKRNLIMSLLQR